MFKKIVEYLLTLLDDIRCLMRDAYEETYGCEDVAREFDCEVRLRRRRNKDEFIVRAMKQVTKDILKKEGYIIPPATAAVIAERLFEEAIANDDIDELNNLKVRKED